MPLLKKILLALLFLPLVMPAAALAEGSTDSNVPELNPLCWRESDCAQIRKNLNTSMTDTEAKAGCISSAPCDKSIGTDNRWCKCLPAGAVSSSIAIGGKSSFLHLGEYILQVYDYALKAAGVVAVLVLIIAGIQWLTSGGNADTITRSKKRIAGAFIGLFIAYGSFFILHNINPATLSLRLPQVWMVRTDQIIPQFCSSLPNTTQFALAAKQTDQTSKVSEPLSDYVYNFKDAEAKKKTDDWFYCGKRFFVKDGGTATCYGDGCPRDSQIGSVSQVCVPQGTGTDVKYSCQKATVAGRIICGQNKCGQQGCGSSILGNIIVGRDRYEAWEFPATDPNEQELWAVCASGWGYEITDRATTVNQTSDQIYTITATAQDIQDAIDKCKKSQGGLYGFIMKFEMNESCQPGKDENHWIGRGGVDLGDDSFFVSTLGYSQALFNIKKVSQSYFYNETEIKGGVALTIDADKIYDIDNEKAWVGAGYLKLAN